MITLTRLNGEEMIVNAQQIESMEAKPDTRVTLMNGKQLYVRESPEEVVQRVRAWLAGLRRGGE
ncbi:MAG: flagellar FlbD family protein [Planctomycetota bacterium]